MLDRYSSKSPAPAPGALLIALLACPLLSAAPPPSLTRVLPAGGQRGQQVEIAVTGANLTSVTAAWFSDRKIAADIIENKDAQSARLRVTIPADADLGHCDLRLLTLGGISNRLAFVVGDLPEASEKEPNSQLSEAQALAVVPAVVNGDIGREDQDFFRFDAKAGQTFVFELCGRRLRPFLRFDNRVGWFDPCLTLHDAAGRELAFLDDFRDEPDPVLMHRFERDGQYVVAVRDAMYRGRSECVYRLRIGAIPYITSTFPLGWHRHSYARLQLLGVNVPAETLFSLPSDAAPLFPVRVTQAGIASNDVPFAVDDVSEVFEADANDEPSTAQRVIAPVAVNGRIEAPGDRDCVVFKGAKGQRLAIEVAARRFGSPLDSLLQVLTPDGKQLAASDDNEATPTQLHRADARIDFTLPSDGDFVVRLQDFLSRGGEDFAYRLLLAPPLPRFELEATPDNPRLDRGGTCLVTVSIVRRDGFDGDVKITPESLPPGVIASEARIAKGQNSTLLSLSATSAAPVGAMALPLRLVGQAEGLSAPTKQIATAVERLEYVNNRVQDVPVQEAVLAITPTSAPFQLAVKARQTDVRRKGKIEWQVTARRTPGVTAPISLSVQGLPRNVAAPTATIPADKTEATLTISADANAAPGIYSCAVVGTMTLDKQPIVQPAQALSLSVLAE